jgi:hypothetical protein
MKLFKILRAECKNVPIVNLYNKRVCPTKNEPQQGISYLEREGGGEREKGGRG